ncbi:MAG: carbonic anhydrase [Bdellovibrionales bacterium GWA2_49_15]|nr:MAG: carbonic anhydrase [Bdellovibrionales bacterium GWA2_49_15]HAZ13873.1 carbonic anhydrase [Bdellovibrionales bacterium]
MKKLLQGIVKFRREVLPGYRETFARLALGQSPDALFIGCSDSRVAVNVFASTDPGDLFVVRNVGNLVPPYEENAQLSADESEAAAVEFALNSLNVSNIIVCGHSECGAMQALAAGREKVETPCLREWLRHGDGAVKILNSSCNPSTQFGQHNRLSQINVLRQIEHLKTYPAVQARLKTGALTLHAWWFELKYADVYAYEESVSQFVLIDEMEVARILERMENKP